MMINRVILIKVYLNLVIIDMWWLIKVREIDLNDL